MPTIDTNIIVRHLTADHPDHSPRARRFFQELAAGTSSATLREAVLVESVFVDALLAAAAEREDGVVLTFDRGFDRLSAISRAEP